MWAWDGTRWEELTPAHRPTPRARARFASNPHDGTTLLVGGDNAPSDTWLWNGEDWTTFTTTSNPSASWVRNNFV